MHQNRLWMGLLITVLAVAFWFSASAVWALFHFAKYSQRVEGFIEKCEIQEIKKGKFGVFAHVHYFFGEKGYQSFGQLSATYPNGWAAQKAKERLDGKEKLIWIDPRHPQNALLQKQFPLKKTLSAAVLVGLTLYFVCIGFYVGKRGNA